jgi:hypothetical protein
MPQRHRVELGTVTDEIAEIRGGLTDGEEVVLNPREVIEAARRDDAILSRIDVARRFGTAAEAVESFGDSHLRKQQGAEAGAGGE